MNSPTQIFFLLIYISFISLPAEALECWANEQICKNPLENPEECTNPEDGSFYTTPVLNETACGANPGICFSTWEIFDNGTFKMNLLFGCIENAKTTTQGCVSEDRCVDNGRRRNKIFPNTLFCCCGTDGCNKNLTIAPLTTTTTSTTTPNAILDNAPIRIEAEEKISYYLVYTVFPISMLLLLIIMYLLKKRKSHFSQVPNVDQHSQSAPSTPSNDKLRSIKLEEPIAQGKFGAVWKATFKNEVVAVKIMPAQEKHPWLTEQEVFKSHHMNHDNILRFIAAEKKGTEYWIVTAYHPMGSLYEFLKTHTITWEQFLSLGFTIARGLAHLHNEIMPIRGEDYKPIIAHRDFKSGNILLKNDLTACIADFDLALIFKLNQPCGDTHGQVGTRRYMAPEVLEGAINFSSEAFLRIDMYAFGLVLWELASRCSSLYPDSVPCYKLPFEAEVGVHPSVEDMLEIVVQQKRRPIIKKPWLHHEGFAALCSCIEESWDHDPEARISAPCVMERFKDHIKIFETSSTPLLYDIITTPATLNGLNPGLTNGYLAA